MTPAEWRTGTPLPGFVASDAQIGRLEDAPDGARRYQARLHVRNTESVAGHVSVSADSYGIMDPSAPVRVGAGESVEIDWVGSEPAQVLWLHSYLSLNRHPLPIKVSTGDPERPVAESPFGVRPSGWLPDNAGDVVVDDLDPGFSIGQQPVDREGADLDSGLPVYARFEMPLAADTWYREAVPSAWGRHRRTLAVVRGGDGDRAVAFAADLPREGRWRLDYHIPPASPPHFPGGTPQLEHISWLGAYDMTIRTGRREMPRREMPVEFDGGAAQPGWNEIGTFDMDAEPVHVLVTNRTDGEVVVADAIRWRLVPAVTVGRSVE